MTTGATVRLADLCDLIAESVRPGARPDALYLGLEHLVPGRLVRIGGKSVRYEEQYLGVPTRRRAI